MEGNNKSIIAAVIAILIGIGVVIWVTSSSSDDESDSVQVQQIEDTSTERDADEVEVVAEEVQQSNIVELAQATDDLSTLVAAVIEAELVDTLSGEGPFTVFAPTNDAFGDLLAELGISAEELLARDDLGAILTYHVVAGDVRAADLSDGQVVDTVQGGQLTVSFHDGSVMLTDANGGTSMITATDIEASNGVVHLIDSVVLP